jgi:hypothetical protein
MLFLPGACSAQEHYVINANSKKLLYLLCIGLNNDGGTALFDISEPPFTKLKKRAVKPKRDEYAAEVIWRANIIFNQQSTNSKGGELGYHQIYRLAALKSYC